MTDERVISYCLSLWLETVSPRGDFSPSCLSPNQYSSFIYLTRGSDPVGRGLVRADASRCLTRRSDLWALRPVDAPDPWALLPPVGAPTRGLSHPWALLLP